MNLKSAGLTNGGLESPRGKLGGQFGGKPGLNPCNKTQHINTVIIAKQQQQQQQLSQLIYSKNSLHN